MGSRGIWWVLLRYFQLVERIHGRGGPDDQGRNSTDPGDEWSKVKARTKGDGGMRERVIAKGVRFRTGRTGGG